jgi:N-acetylglucosaminyl-diphospho-decaprenol L-rhamnosyltransferase
LVKNSRNIGYSSANNQAVALSRAPYILVLNPDTLLRPGCLIGLIRGLMSDEKIGVVGPRILGSDGQIQKSCARRRFSLDAALFCEALQLHRLPFIGYSISRSFLYPYDYGCDQTVDAISGAAFLIRRALYLSLGGFDTDYYFGGEDLDFFHRANKHGLCIRYLSSTEVVHFGGRSSSQADVKMSILAAISNWRYFHKLYGGVNAAIYRLIAQVIRVPMLIISGLFEFAFLGNTRQLVRDLRIARGFIIWDSRQEEERTSK